MPWDRNSTNGSGEPGGNIHRFPKRGGKVPGEWPISPSFLGLCAAFVVLAGVMLLFPQYARGAVFPFIFAGWIISLCLHEFGHAYVAYRTGDYTVKEKGYLTLDPFRYADPINSIVFPTLILAMGGIGLPGGSVWINRDLIRDKMHQTMMSAAGPLANLLVLVVIIATMNTFAGTLAQAPILRASLAFLALVQLTSIVFNLLPIPGLDGFGIIQPWLPYHIQETANRMAPLIFIGFLVAILMVPGVSAVIWSLVRILGEPFGMNYGWASQGLRLFQFWR